MFKHLFSLKQLGQAKPNCLWSIHVLGLKTFLLAASVSLDQDGRHAHIWLKPLEHLFLQNQWTDFHETWYVGFGTRVHHKLARSKNARHIFPHLFFQVAMIGIKCLYMHLVLYTLHTLSIFFNNLQYFRLFDYHCTK